MIDKHLRLGKQLAHDGDEQEGERAPVDSHPVRTGEEQGLDERVRAHGIGEFAQLSVDERGDDRHLLLAQSCLHVGLQRCPQGRLEGATVRQANSGRFARPRFPDL